MRFYSTANQSSLGTLLRSCSFHKDFPRGLLHISCFALCKSVYVYVVCECCFKGVHTFYAKQACIPTWSTSQSGVQAYLTRQVTRPTRCYGAIAFDTAQHGLCTRTSVPHISCREAPSLPPSPWILPKGNSCTYGSERRQHPFLS